MNTEARMATCRCRRCGGDIEFDPATFEVSHQSYGTSFGQEIDCPVCGLRTPLTKARKIPPGSGGEIFLYVAGAIVLLGFNVVIGVSLIAAGLVINILRRNAA